MNALFYFWMAQVVLRARAAFSRLDRAVQILYFRCCFSALPPLVRLLLMFLLPTLFPRAGISQPSARITRIPSSGTFHNPSSGASLWNRHKAQQEKASTHAHAVRPSTPPPSRFASETTRSAPNGFTAFSAVAAQALWSAARQRAADAFQKSRSE